MHVRASRGIGVGSAFGSSGADSTGSSAFAGGALRLRRQGDLRIVRLVHLQAHAGNGRAFGPRRGARGIRRRRRALGRCRDVPSRGRIGADHRVDRTLHDDRVLAIGIVMRAHADRAHANRLVKRLRAGVVQAHFEGHLGSTQIAGIRSDARDKLPRDAATAPSGIGADFQDLNPAIDDEAAGIADQLKLIARLRAGRAGKGARGSATRRDG